MDINSSALSRDTLRSRRIQRIAKSSFFVPLLHVDEQQSFFSPRAASMRQMHVLQIQLDNLATPSCLYPPVSCHTNETNANSHMVCAAWWCCFWSNQGPGTPRHQKHTDGTVRSSPKASGQESGFRVFSPCAPFCCVVQRHPASVFQFVPGKHFIQVLLGSTLLSNLTISGFSVGAPVCFLRLLIVFILLSSQSVFLCDPVAVPHSSN